MRLLLKGCRSLAMPHIPFSADGSTACKLECVSGLVVLDMAVLASAQCFALDRCQDKSLVSTRLWTELEGHAENPRPESAADGLLWQQVLRSGCVHQR